MYNIYINMYIYIYIVMYNIYINMYNKQNKNELTPSQNNNTKFTRYYFIYFSALKHTFLISE